MQGFELANRACQKEALNSALNMSKGRTHGRGSSRKVKKEHKTFLQDPRVASVCDIKRLGAEGPKHVGVHSRGRRFDDASDDAGVYDDVNLGSLPVSRLQRLRERLRSEKPRGVRCSVFCVPEGRFDVCRHYPLVNKRTSCVESLL